MSRKHGCDLNSLRSCPKQDGWPGKRAGFSSAESQPSVTPKFFVEDKDLGIQALDIPGELQTGANFVKQLSCNRELRV